MLARLFRVVCLGAAYCAACSEDRAAATLAPAPLAPATVFPALQRERLDYLFEAATRVQRSWPFMSPASTCVLLIEAQVQWALSCDVAPPGFAALAERFRGHPVYRHAAASFESAGRSQTTAELLAQTPAAAHVPLTAASAAGLPGAQPWLVIGSLEALAAFHPAFPDGTTEAWVSVAIHELIHTHQLRAPGFAPVLAQIQSGERNPTRLTQLFGRDLRYRALVEREYALLVRAAERRAEDRRSARQALRAWLALYSERARHLHARADGSELLRDDALFSYIEGAARFVESTFLAEPALHPERAPQADPRFRAYAQFQGRGYAGSPNRQLDEQYFYAIGYHLCVLLERVDPGWRERVHIRSRYLIDLVEEVAAHAD